MAGKFSISAYFTGDDKVTPVVRRMRGSLEGFGRGLRSLQRPLRGIQSGIRGIASVASPAISKLGDLGKAAAATGVALAGLGLGHVVKTGAEFEAALSGVQAVAKLSAEELEKLANVARTMGPKFGVGPTQATEVLETMIKAGFDATDAANGLSTALAAVVAAKGDVGIVEQLMSSVKGLGLANDQLGRVSDVFSKAADATKADVATVAQSMAKFGPVSRQFGFSLESTVGMIALLQDAGLDASEVGTSLASSFSKLAAPATEAQKQIARLGLVLKDAKGNLLPPAQLLTNIKTALDKVQGSAEKADVIKDLVGLESQKALLNLTADLGKLETITKSLEGAGGYTEAFAGDVLDNVAGSWKKLTATVEAFETQLFSLKSGALKGIIDGLADWIGKNQDLFATRVGDWIASLAPYIETFVDAFKGAWGPMQQFLGWFTGGTGSTEDWGKTLLNVATVLGKVTALTLGVGIAVGSTLVEAFRLGANAITWATETIGAAWDGMIRGIGASIFWVVDAWENFKARIDAQGLMRTLADSIVKFGELPVKAFVAVVKKIRDFLPFSPAKEGPLRDLDKIKLVETVAHSINAAPAVKAMERVARGIAGVDMPAVNTTPLGSDARPAPQVFSPTERSATRVERSVTEMRDKVEIVVRAADDTEAEVVQRPRRAKLTMRSSGVEA